MGKLPSWRSVFVGLNDDHFDGHRRAQQVNHLLVGERGHGHLADLHQPAALPQARLPSEAERLHVGHDAFKVDVEAELAQAVPPQSYLRRLAASGGDLESRTEAEMFIICRKCAADFAWMKCYRHKKTDGIAQMKSGDIFW